MIQIETLLRERLDAMSLVLNADQIEQLMGYIALLHQWNQVHNFTKEKTLEAIVERHIVNSLAVYSLITDGPCMDVGSGPGLPGIPLAIVSPHLHWDLIESRQKRVSFLRHCCQQLKLTNVHPHLTRLEDFMPQQLYKTIVARAFCQPKDYVKQVSPFLAEDGQTLLMVGEHFLLGDHGGELVCGALPTARIWRVR